MLHRRVINALVVLCALAFTLPEFGQVAEAAQGARSTDESRRADREPVRVFAAPFKTSARAATVVLSVEADAAMLGLPAFAGRYERPLEVAWTATDEHGGRRTGTAYDGTLTIDAASISSAQAMTFTSGGHPRLMLPLTPTSRREFETGEAIGLFTEVYESRLRLDRSPARGTSADPGDLGDHTTHLLLELHDDDGSILQTVAADHSMDRGRAGSHSFVARLPLDVPSYLLSSVF